MIDVQLNKSLEETKELQTRWSQFRDYVRMAIERKKVSPEAEMKFLELKSYIAILHDGFMAKLTHDQKVGQAIMSILGDSIMLSRIANYNDAEKQKFDFDWNECYLLISEQTQGLSDEKERLAGISERSYKAGRRKEIIMTKIHNFIHSAGLKYTIILICLIFVLYVVPAFLWSYRGLKDIPVVNKLYYTVADKVYRPYLDKEYEYDAWDNLNMLPLHDIDPPVPRISKQDSAALDKKYFINNVLFAMGVSRADFPAIAQTLNTDVTEFQSERFKADEDDVLFFYLFFNTSENARKFTDAVHKDFAALPLAQQQAIQSDIYLLRTANFVAVGKSKHGMRIGHITGKMQLGKDPSNILFAL